MIKFLSILLALTCASAWGQSAILQASGAGNVRGVNTITTNVSSVLTNLTVTGTLDPDITGTNYVQIEAIYGHPAWSCTSIPEWYEATGYSNVYVQFNDDWGSSNFWISGSPGASYGERWVNTNGVPTGTYNPDYGVTGTATVAYWYQTNYLVVGSVTVHGKATP